MVFFKDWRSFVKQNYKDILFICLFYSSALVALYAYGHDLELKSFPGRMIGIATLEGVDISKRVSLFYNCVGIFIIGAIIIYLLFFLISKAKYNPFKSSDLRVFNASSAAGFFLVIFWAMGVKTGSCIKLLLCMQAIVLAGLLIQKKYLKRGNQKTFSIPAFSIIFCAGTSFFFLFKELITLLNIELKAPFFVLFFIICLCYIIFIVWRLKGQDSQRSQAIITKLFWVLFPCTLLPALSVIKNEIYLILTDRGVEGFSLPAIYFTLIILILVWILFRIRKNSGPFVKLSPYRLMSEYYFPAFIVSVTAFLYYNPLTFGGDMFEDANRILPVMEWYNYGIIPLIEKFNSHVLSEIFLPFIYTFFHGLKGPEFVIYDFLLPVSTAIITYYILFRFTNNPYLALFTIFLFPSAEILISTYFAITLLTIFILQKIIYKAPSIKGYLWFIIMIAFFIAWRIDLGIAVLMGSIFLLIIYALRYGLSINIKQLLVAAGITCAAILMMGIFLFLAGINIGTKAIDAYNYLSSSQSYGYIALGNASQNAFKMQYYLFPLIALLIGGYVVLIFKKSSLNKRTRFAFICILFCIGFYFANFQRGVVRHGFIENSDIFLSSFIFFIIPASIYFIANNRSHIFKFCLFTSVAFFFITAFKFPEQTGTIAFEDLKTKIDSFPEANPELVLKREIALNAYENKYSDFKNFIAENLKPEETFLDFSNTPMFYYYTRKITPSYFQQSPQNIHNNHLQKRFIEDLSKYKIPFAVFSKSQPDYWDETDGVPNTLRHYRIAEYLYREYAPFVVIQRYCIWKKKDSILKNKTIFFLDYPSGTPNKAYWDTILHTNVLGGELLSKGKNILISATYKNLPYSDIFLSYSKDGTKVKTPIFATVVDSASRTAYFSIKEEKGKKLRFFSGNMSNIARLKINEQDNLPDFYSGLYKSFNLKKLPYIWANYDKKISFAPLQAVIFEKDTMINSIPAIFKLPENIDKSTGNYIHITLTANNNMPLEAILRYGENNNNNGEFHFIIPQGEGQRTFAIRISSQYNWYNKTNAYIIIHADTEIPVIVNKISLLKGD